MITRNCTTGNISIIDRHNPIANIYNIMADNRLEYAAKYPKHILVHTSTKKMNETSLTELASDIFPNYGVTKN
jgi:hypothetical protein